MSEASGMEKTTERDRPLDVVAGPWCWEENSFMGYQFACDRPLGHEGEHGHGPFVEYSLTWPQETADDA